MKGRSHIANSWNVTLRSCIVNRIWRVHHSAAFHHIPTFDWIHSYKLAYKFPFNVGVKWKSKQGVPSVNTSSGADPSTFRRAPALDTVLFVRHLPWCTSPLMPIGRGAIACNTRLETLISRLRRLSTALPEHFAIFNVPDLQILLFCVAKEKAPAGYFDLGITGS